MLRKNGQPQALLSKFSEQNISQSVKQLNKFQLNGQLTKLVYTLTKTKGWNSFKTFEELSCLGSIFL